MQEIGKLLILLGIMIAGMGFLLLFLEKAPFLGKLPGDILIKKENFIFYSPITTSIITSIILTIIFSILFSIKR